MHSESHQELLFKEQVSNAFSAKARTRLPDIRPDNMNINHIIHGLSLDPLILCASLS